MEKGDIKSYIKRYKVYLPYHSKFWIIEKNIMQKKITSNFYNSNDFKSSNFYKPISNY